MPGPLAPSPVSKPPGTTGTTQWTSGQTFLTSARLLSTAQTLTRGLVSKTRRHLSRLAIIRQGCRAHTQGQQGLLRASRACSMRMLRTACLGSQTMRGRRRAVMAISVSHTSVLWLTGRLSRCLSCRCAVTITGNILVLLACISISRCICLVYASIHASAFAPLLFHSAWMLCLAASVTATLTMLQKVCCQWT